MGLTLMFGLPVSALPCKEAWLSIIPQVQKWQNQRYLDGENESLIRFESGFSTESYSTFNHLSSSKCNDEEDDDYGDNSNEGKLVIDIPELVHKAPEHNHFVNVFAAIFLQAFAFTVAISVPGELLSF